MSIRSCKVESKEVTPQILLEAGTQKALSARGCRMDSQVPPVLVFKTGSINGAGDSLMALGMISGTPCEITVDTGSNISIVRSDLSVINQDLFQPVHSYNQTVTGEQASIHGKGRLELGITCGDSSGAVGC